MDKLSKLMLAPILIILLCLITVTYSDSSLVVVDVLGRTITIPGKPSKVVVLAPSITEILVYLGVDDVIAGADSFSLNVWFMNAGSKLRVRNVTSIGEYWWTSISVEKIIELQPDLILADTGAHRPLLETFEAYNLTVFYLHGGSARTVYDAYSDIQMLGLIFNKTHRAEELIGTIEKEIEETRYLIENTGYKGLRVLVVIDFWGGIWIAGRATFMDDIITRLGLVNAANAYGWTLTSIEQVVEWNPDIIIVACWYATEETVRGSGLFNLGRPVILLNSTEIDVLSRPGPLTMYVPSVIYNAISRTVQPPKTIKTPIKEVRDTEDQEPGVQLVGEQQSTETPVEKVGELRIEVVVAVLAVLVIVSSIIGYILGYRLRRG